MNQTYPTQCEQMMVIENFPHHTITKVDDGSWRIENDYVLFLQRRVVKNNNNNDNNDDDHGSQFEIEQPLF